MYLKKINALEPQFRGLFPSLEVRNIVNGKQAECVILNTYEDIQTPCVLKIIGKNKGFTKSEVDLLIEETITYRKDLQNARVKIPINYKIFSLKDNTDNWRIFIIDEFVDCGGDLDMRLKDPHLSINEKVRCVKMMIDFVSDLPTGTTGHDTLVLGDFKPSNFVERNLELILIDYFNPKRRSSGGLVYPYIEKTNRLDQTAITFLCGDRRGIIGRLLAFIKMDYPEVSQTANQYAMKVFTKKYPEISNWLSKEISKQFKTIADCYKINKSKEYYDKILENM